MQLLSVFLLAASPQASPADDAPRKVDASLHIIADLETIRVNVENDPLTDWVKPIFKRIDEQFQNEAKMRTIVFEATVHTDRPADVAVAGRPGLSLEETAAVLKAADPTRSPRTRVVDCTLRIVAKVNGGTPEDAGSLVPPLPTLGQRKLARFQPLSTPQKLAFMRSWARTQAIPLLAEFALHRDHPEDEATRRLGKSLRDVPRQGPIDVRGLTEKNRDYWLAIMAAPQRDPLVSAALVALLVASGENQRAWRVSRAIAPFDDRTWGGSSVLADFRWMENYLDGEVGDRIRKGIELNDQGRYDEAEAIYNAVLKDYPKLAWAHYERFQTRLVRVLKSPSAQVKVMAEWPQIRKAILDADPLYGSMPTAIGPNEVYDMLLRKEIDELFKDAKEIGRPMVRYADIARELNEPGFAALLYWNVLRNIKPEQYGERNLIEDMLYCLEQLAVKDLKASFPGDHIAEFKRIDAERAKQKRESAAFRSFAEPNDTATKNAHPAR
jgi:tetratricopeptide (TPR) repeat protein